MLYHNVLECTREVPTGDPKQKLITRIQRRELMMKSVGMSWKVAPSILNFWFFESNMQLEKIWTNYLSWYLWCALLFTFLSESVYCFNINPYKNTFEPKWISKAWNEAATAVGSTIWFSYYYVMWNNYWSLRLCDETENLTILFFSSWFQGKTSVL